ncbi:hypothetical protein DVH05_011840 [Phytophthora capsici]|nr:hypothetical protein DVH05_011840 [Phytophthora capsici]
MTKTRTQTSTAAPRPGMQTRSQSPKTSSQVADTNTEGRATDEREEASQAAPAENPSTTPARAKGKRRRVRKGSFHVASDDEEDPESTDSGEVQTRTVRASTPAAPQAEILRIVEVDRPAPATAGKAPAARDNDCERSGGSRGVLNVVDLHKAVAQLTEAVAEMRRERQLTPSRAATATPPVEQSVTEPIGQEPLHDSRGSRQRRRATATRTKERQRHGMERRRSLQRYQVNGVSSDESSGDMDAEEYRKKWRSRPSQRRTTTRRQRVVRRNSPSSSSSESFNGSSSDDQRQRRAPRKTSHRVHRQQPDSDGNDFSSDGSDDDDESSEADSERSRSESRKGQRRERNQRRGHRARHEQREEYGRG